MSGVSVMGRLSLLLALGTCPLLVLGPQAAVAAPDKKKKKKGKKDKKDKKKAKPAVATIVTARKRIKDATILAEKFAGVEYKRGSNTKETVKGDRVLEIRYNDPPSSYLAGRSQLRTRRYRRAAETFDKMRRKDRKKGPWVRAYATFYLAEAKRLGNEYGDAISEYEGFIKKYPGHLLTPNAIYGLGRAQVGARKSKSAVKNFKKLEKSYGNVWSAKGFLGQGDAHVAAKRPDLGAARTAYSKAKAKGILELTLMAQIGDGRALIKRKDYKRAITEFKKNILDRYRKKCPPEVAAWAWVGIGDAYLEQAKAKGNNTDLRKEALIAYLTCVTRFRVNNEAYPNALFEAAELYEKLGKRKKAEALRTELVKSCPNSTWTKKLN